MKILASLAALFSMVALLLSPLPAAATTVSECQGDIATLLLQTQGTTYSGGVGNKAEQAQAKAEANLYQASKKVDQVRFDDAIAQMQEYEAAVAFSLSKGFITEVDAAALTTGADGVIACIQQIGV